MRIRKRAKKRPKKSSACEECLVPKMAIGRTVVNGLRQILPIHNISRMKCICLIPEACASRGVGVSSVSWQLMIERLIWESKNTGVRYDEPWITHDHGAEGERNLP